MNTSALWAFGSGLTVGLSWPSIQKLNPTLWQKLAVASLVSLIWPVVAVLLAFDSYNSYLDRIDGLHDDKEP